MYKAEDLPKAMQNFLLPSPPTGQDLKVAVRASLDMISVFPAPVGYSLVAAVYRAPLPETRFAIYIAGPTGAGKSEAAALVQQHYGSEMKNGNLPGSWSSTSNYNESMAFHSKDAILTIDDFCPRGGWHDVEKLHKEADRLFRAQGNGAGRGRMKADQSLARTHFPRGLIVSTGEDIPKGHSMRARLWVIELGPKDVDFNRLTKAQQDASNGLYAQALAAYLQWLSPRYDEILKSYKDQIATLRERAASDSQHRRTPEMTASLAYGFSTFLDFALDSGCIDCTQHRVLWERCWTSLGEIASNQFSLQASSDPVDRFIELLSQAVRSGLAHIAKIDGSYPDNPRAWGWADAASACWRGNGMKIGWIDGDDLYLLPDAAHKAAQDMAKSGGDNLLITPATLWKRLSERRILKSEDNKRGRRSIRKIIEGTRSAVLHLDSSVICSAIPSQLSREQESAEKSGDWIDDCLDDACPNGPSSVDELSQSMKVDSSGFTGRSCDGHEGLASGETSGEFDLQWTQGEPCRNCGDTVYWKSGRGGAWRCRTCHPCPGGDVDTTLPEHLLFQSLHAPSMIN